MGRSLWPLIASLWVLGCRAEERSSLPALAASEPSQQDPGAPLISELTPREAGPPAEARPAPPKPAAVCALPERGAPLGEPWISGPRGWVGAEVRGAGRKKTDPALRRARARVLRCYQASLQDAPDLRGSIAFSIVLDAAGEPREVDLTPEDDLPPSLLRCAEASLRGVRFEASSGPRIDGRFELRPSRPGREAD